MGYSRWLNLSKGGQYSALESLTWATTYFPRSFLVSISTCNNMWHQFQHNQINFNLFLPKGWGLIDLIWGKLVTRVQGICLKSCAKFPQNRTLCLRDAIRPQPLREYFMDSCQKCHIWQEGSCWFFCRQYHTRPYKQALTFSSNAFTFSSNSFEFSKYHESFW